MAYGAVSLPMGFALADVSPSLVPPGSAPSGRFRPHWRSACFRGRIHCSSWPGNRVVFFVFVGVLVEFHWLWILDPLTDLDRVRH